MAVDNAASRLKTLLVAAKNIDANMPAGRAWDTLLKAEGNSATLLYRLGKMLALPHEITITISGRSGVDPAVVSYIAAQLNAAFGAQKFSEKWGEFTKRVDAHVLNYLDLASGLMEANVTTKLIQDSDIDDLRLQFSNLLDEVRGSDLEAKLKSHIVIQIYNVLASLDDYFITGAAPVLKHVESTIGHAYMDNEYRGFLQNHKLGKSLLECLTAAANLVTVAVGVPEITHAVLLLAQSVS